MKSLYKWSDLICACGFGIAANATPLVALLEEHGEALTHWQLMVDEGLMERLPHTVLHIDSHADFRVPSFRIEPDEFSIWTGQWSRDEILTRMAKPLQIDTFLILAAWLGLTDDIIFMAPPWHRDFRPYFEYLDLHFMVGLVGAEFKAAVQPVGEMFTKMDDATDALFSEMGGSLIPWQERGTMHHSAEFRYRVLPAEFALQFLRSEDFFKGNNHTRLLLDFDMDVLSTHSPRSLQLTGKYFSVEELTVLNRARLNLSWDLVAPFRRALGERALSAIVGHDEGFNPEQAFATHPSLRESCLRCPDLLAAYSSGGLAEVVNFAVRAIDAEFVFNIIDEAVSMPYQISDAVALSVQERFWTAALQALPVAPVALTLSRSPFFSPIESVRSQECLVLGIISKLWPSAAPLRIGEHVRTWHLACSSNQTEINLADLPTDNVGLFEGCTPTEQLWQHAVPDGVSEIFSMEQQLIEGDYREDEETESKEAYQAHDLEADKRHKIQIINPNRGRVEILRKGPDYEVSYGTVEQGHRISIDAYIGHKFVARCVQQPSAYEFAYVIDDKSDAEVHLPLMGCRSSEL